MQNSYDIDFEVPFRHRIRFTENLVEEETNVLLDLLQSPGELKPRVLVVVDDQLLEHSGRIAELIVKLQNCENILLVDGGSSRQSSPAFAMPGGEVVKNSAEHVEQLLSLINERNLDRRSFIVAIGGGAVLDAAGYAAAIAHRGIRLIRIPTTTLAQGDSGVGVKNAINFFKKKNWIGTFAVPWAVINDAALLTTLPTRDFRCGFSEAIKVALLKSPDDFSELCDQAQQIANREMNVAFDAIKKSCLWHLKHITRGGDPFEALEARPLDFGHWSAHKMEQMSGYRLRHGEAVGIGVAIDCIYSSRVLGFPERDVQRVIKCLQDFHLPLWDSTLNDFEVLKAGLEEFRQHLGGKLTVTMLNEVGDSVNVHEIDMNEMRTSIETLRELAKNKQTIHDSESRAT